MLYTILHLPLPSPLPLHYLCINISPTLVRCNLCIYYVLYIPNDLYIFRCRLLRAGSAFSSGSAFRLYVPLPYLLLLSHMLYLLYKCTLHVLYALGTLYALYALYILCILCTCMLYMPYPMPLPLPLPLARVLPSSSSPSSSCAMQPLHLLVHTYVQPARSPGHTYIHLAARGPPTHLGPLR